MAQQMVLDSDALLLHAFKFLPDNCFRYIAGVNPKFRSCYWKRQQEGETEDTPARRSKKFKTSLVHAVATTGQAEVFFKEPHALRSTSFCNCAAKHGKLEVLQWARANGCDWDVHTCACAAEGGHLEVLQWARANGCDWDTWTCFHAARTGRLEVLQWVRANGCAWDTWTCAAAAGGGHLEVLRWVRANGCAWDTWTCANASGGGHLEVLKWARANGCDWDSVNCLARAERRTEMTDVVQWIRENSEN